MAKCCRCGEKFKVSDARAEYNSEFGAGFDYDEDYHGEVCADCAIADTHTNMNIGKAIDMMNGDEDYDEDHVQKWL